MAKPLKTTPTRLNKTTKKLLLEISTRAEFAESEYEQEYQRGHMRRLLGNILDTPSNPPIEDWLLDMGIGDTRSAEITNLVTDVSQRIQTIEDNKCIEHVLLSIPLLISSRYRIPPAQPTPAILKQVLDGLRDIVVTPGTRLVLTPAPRSAAIGFWLLRDSRALLRTLMAETDTIAGPHTKPEQIPDDLHLLADHQHWFVLASNESHVPILRAYDDAANALKQRRQRWAQYMEPIIKSMYVGCTGQALLPGTAEESEREAHDEIQPIGVQATVEWLTEALGVSASVLTATIAPFDIGGSVEYRIGYSLDDEPHAIHGSVWQRAFDIEDLGHLAENPVVEELTTILQDSGITLVNMLVTLFDDMHCEECYAPLFPGPDGNLHHTRMPDNLLDTPLHLH